MQSERDPAREYEGHNEDRTRGFSRSPALSISVALGGKLNALSLPQRSVTRREESWSLRTLLLPLAGKYLTIQDQRLSPVFYCSLEWDFCTWLYFYFIISCQKKPLRCIQFPSFFLAKLLSFTWTSAAIKTLDFHLLEIEMWGEMY